MVIRVLLVVFLMLAAATVFAKDIASTSSDDGQKVTLTDQRAGCDFDSGAMRLRWESDGKTVMGCYVVRDGVVLIKYDDGDIGRLRVQAFRPAV
jgi:hypothetical protein